MPKPLYFFGGLLDSGKTSVIKETLLSPQFNEGERVLIIALEDGEESYDERFLHYANARVVYLDSFKELNLEKMKELDELEDFDEIFVEGNGMEDEWPFLLNVQAFKKWEVAQTLSVVDASTFKMNVLNLKTFLYYHIKSAECIIFNRFENIKEDYLFIRNNVLGLNPKAELIFEDKNGEIVSFKDFELFDLSKDLLYISDIDYGAWYVDAGANPSKYAGKRISINVKWTADLPKYDKACIMGREAMICCSEDIASMAITVVGIDKKKIKPGHFYRLEGVIHTVEAEDGYDTCLLYLDKIADGEALKDPMVYFN